MKLASLLLLVVAVAALVGCGGEDCSLETVDVPFQLTERPAGYWRADVAIDRCGGDGSEELRYEVTCSGNCPAFTARVFLDSYMIAEEPSVEPYTEIVAHESTNPDINEYELNVEADPNVPTDTYTLTGSFTGARAQVLP